MVLLLAKRVSLTPAEASISLLAKEASESAYLSLI